VCQVEAGSVKGEVLAAWGADDFLVNTADGMLLLGKLSNLWNGTGEVN